MSIKLASEHNIDELASPIIQLFRQFQYSLVNNFLSNFPKHIQIVRFVLVEIADIPPVTIYSMLYLL